MSDLAAPGDGPSAEEGPTPPLPLTLSEEQLATFRAELAARLPEIEEAIRRLREAEKVSPEVMNLRITI